MMDDDHSPWWVHALGWGIALAPFVAYGLWLALR